ncbi:hypothetical protein NAEX_03608 [Nannocystis exedens]|nr:hypothetical protein NAEX_01470 [Nannocystis exedens]PCC69448.1 hypothetical protein NAEX_02470 [Nannocystis exedens]PCC70544.1 hypothetical protein NAEX_03608 [Nannocystis exedens]
MLRAYRRLAARTDTSRCWAAQSFPQYRCPRSQARHTETCRRHLPQLNSRWLSSSIDHVPGHALRWTSPSPRRTLLPSLLCWLSFWGTAGYDTER